MTKNTVAERNGAREEIWQVEVVIARCVVEGRALSGRA